MDRLLSTVEDLDELSAQVAEYIMGHRWVAFPDMSTESLLKTHTGKVELCNDATIECFTQPDVMKYCPVTVLSGRMEGFTNWPTVYNGLKYARVYHRAIAAYKYVSEWQTLCMQADVHGSSGWTVKLKFYSKHDDGDIYEYPDGQGDGVELPEAICRALLNLLEKSEWFRKNYRKDRDNPDA